MTFADRALSVRLERAEGLASAGFVDARLRSNPASDARRIELEDVYAMYDGPVSPVTQTFGLGMSGVVTADLLKRIEQFFLERSAPVLHEVSPFADESVWPLLCARGYAPFEYSSVMFIDLPANTEPSRNTIEVRLADATEHELWAQTATAGWSEFGVDPSLLRMAAASQGVVPFLAEDNGQPVATGALNIQSDIALLAGASTVPAARNRGAQRALLQARLSYAAQAGCAVAMIVTQPGSASQRNAERRGFRIAYTRCKWRLDVSV